MAKRLRSWLALPAAERVAVLVMVMALPMIALLLRTVGFSRTFNLVGAISDRIPRTAESRARLSPEALARLARVAGRHGPVDANCLKQSLLLYGWLRARNLTPRLQFGVRKVADSIDAHAWIELEGRALGEPSQLRFEPFAPVTH